MVTTDQVVTVIDNCSEIYAYDWLLGIYLFYILHTCHISAIYEHFVCGRGFRCYFSNLSQDQQNIKCWNISDLNWQFPYIKQRKKASQLKENLRPSLRSLVLRCFNYLRTANGISKQLTFLLI